MYFYRINLDIFNFLCNKYQAEYDQHGNVAIQKMYRYVFPKRFFFFRSVSHWGDFPLLPVPEITVVTRCLHWKISPHPLHDANLFSFKPIKAKEKHSNDDPTKKYQQWLYPRFTHTVCSVGNAAIPASFPQHIAMFAIRCWYQHKDNKTAKGSQTHGSLPALDRMV